MTTNNKELTTMQLNKITKEYKQEKYEKYRTKEQRGELKLVDIKGTKEIYQWRVTVGDIIKNRIPMGHRHAMKIHSPVFEVSDYYFLLRFFPYGFVRQPSYHNYPGASLSFYLALADEDSYETKEEYPFAQFNLRLVNIDNADASHSNITKHKFTKEATDWGFKSFEEIEKVYNKQNGFLNDKQELLFEIEITVFGEYEVQRHIGIENQGATCYLNSLIQTLYMIPAFRKAIYEIPVANNANPCDNIPYALQRLFYVLQEKPKPKAETIELTKSFGWTSVDALMQHDVQEMARVLIDRLDEKMKGSKSEGVVNDLFKGYTKSFIKCVNVNYESARKEAYLDLQLDVRGCKNVKESFDKYCELELLSGDNQYQSEKHGLQDAQKGSTFLEFPKVLMLQLKRFEYDWQYDIMRKVNDRYEFSAEMSLKNYLDKEGAPSDYVLASVLVHQGDVSGGHYFMFSFDFEEERWYRFDDEFVNEVTMEQVKEASFGDYRSTSRSFSISTAYMLVYIRKDALKDALQDIPATGIPKIIVSHYDRAKKERERRMQERKERPLYCYMTIITKHHIKHSVHREQQDIYYGPQDYYVNIASHLLGNEKSIKVDDPKLPMIRMRVKKDATMEEVAALVHDNLKQYEQHKRKKSAIKNMTSLVSTSTTGWGKVALWELHAKKEQKMVELTLGKEMTRDAHQKQTLNAIYQLQSPKAREFYVYVGDFDKEHVRHEKNEQLMFFKTYIPQEAVIEYAEARLVPTDQPEQAYLKAAEELLPPNTQKDYKPEPPNAVILGVVDSQAEYPNIARYYDEFLPNRNIISLIDIYGKQERIDQVPINEMWDYDRGMQELIKYIDPTRTHNQLRLWSGKFPQGRPINSTNVSHMKVLLNKHVLYYELLQTDLKNVEDFYFIPIHMYDHETLSSSEKPIKTIKVSRQASFAEFVDTVKRKGTFSEFDDFRLEFIVHGEVVLNFNDRAKRTNTPSAMRYWLYYANIFQGRPLTTPTSPHFQLLSVRTQHLREMFEEKDLSQYENHHVDMHYLRPNFFNFPTSFVRFIPKKKQDVIFAVHDDIKRYMMVHRVENINAPFVEEPYPIAASHESTVQQVVKAAIAPFPEKMHAKMSVGLLVFNGRKFSETLLWEGKKLASARAVHSDAAAAAPHLYATKPSEALLDRLPINTTFSNAYHLHLEKNLNGYDRFCYFGLSIHHPSFTRKSGNHGMLERGISIKK